MIPEAFRKTKNLIAILIACCALAGMAQAASMVGDIQVETDTGRVMLKVATTGPVSPKLERAGRKLVIHLPGADREKLDTLKIGSNGIKEVRFGKHPGELRLVLDLSKVSKASLGASSAKGFSVDLGPVSSGPAAGAAPKAPAATAPAAASEADEEALAMAPVSSGLTYRVVDLSFNKSDDHSQVVISSDGPASYKTMLKDGGKMISVLFRNASLSWTPDNAALSDEAVEKFSAKQLSVKGESQVRVDITLKGKLTYAINRDQNQVIVSVSKPEPVAAQKSSGNLDMLVTLDVEQADLIGTLKNLATQAGFESQFTSTLIKLSPDDRTVTFRAEKQPLRDVLNTLLVKNTAMFQQQGNTLLFGSAAEIGELKKMMPKITKFYSPRYQDAATLASLILTAATNDPNWDSKTVVYPNPADPSQFMIVGTEGDVATAMSYIRRLDVPVQGEAAAGEDEGADEGGGGGLKTKIYTLKYLDVTDADLIDKSLKLIIPPLAMSTGAYAYDIDSQSHRLVVHSTLKFIKMTDKLIERIDVKVPQVHIEAKIIEVDDSNAKSLGLEWQFDKSSNNGNQRISGQQLFGQGSTAFATLSNFQGLDFVLGTIDALVSKNKANIISSPSVTSKDGFPAVMKSQETIVIQSSTTIFSANGTPTTTITFTNQTIPIELDVTPRINSEDKTVEMNVSFDLQAVSANAPPGQPAPTSDQSVKTMVTVSSGETAVNGGMNRDSLVRTSSSLLILGDIPLIGLLFKGETVTKVKKDIIVFITPTLDANN